MSNVENATAEKRSAKEGGKSAVEEASTTTVAATTEGGQGQGKSDVTTPPLLVPLESGDAYFLLDDFK